MQKPAGINITAGLMAIFIVFGLVTSFTVAMPPMPTLPMSPSALLTIIRVCSVVFSIIAAVFVWFYWNGQNWARWLVMIDCVFCLFPLIHIARSLQLSPLAGTVSIAQAVMAIFLLWYLNTAEIRAWFSPPATPSLPIGY